MSSLVGRIAALRIAVGLLTCLFVALAAYATAQGDLTQSVGLSTDVTTALEVDDVLQKAFSRSVT